MENQMERRQKQENKLGLEALQELGATRVPTIGAIP